MMSLAYKLFPCGMNYTVRVVNGFELTPQWKSFQVPEDVALDSIFLHKAIREFAIQEMKMHPNAITIWNCHELNLEK